MRGASGLRLILSARARPVRCDPCSAQRLWPPTLPPRRAPTRRAPTRRAPTRRALPPRAPPPRALTRPPDRWPQPPRAHQTSGGQVCRPTRCPAHGPPRRSKCPPCCNCSVRSPTPVSSTCGSANRTCSETPRRSWFAPTTVPGAGATSTRWASFSPVSSGPSPIRTGACAWSSAAVVSRRSRSRALSLALRPRCVVQRPSVRPPTGHGWSPRASRPLPTCCATSAGSTAAVTRLGGARASP